MSPLFRLLFQQLNLSVNVIKSGKVAPLVDLQTKRPWMMRSIATSHWWTLTLHTKTYDWLSSEGSEVNGITENKEEK